MVRVVASDRTCPKSPFYGEPMTLATPTLIAFCLACALVLCAVAVATWILASVTARGRARLRAELCAELRNGLDAQISGGVSQGLAQGLAQGLTHGLSVEMRASRVEMENALARGQGQLGEQLHRALGDVQLSLEGVDKRWTEISSLGADVARLRSIFDEPSRRGRVLGEVTLERLLSDSLPPGYYAFQYPIGTARVDAAVLFPHAGVAIPIDSKFPASGDAQTLVRLARDIASKYVRPDLGTTPFAYLYLPNETLWQDAVSAPRVWEEFVALNVYPVSPHTLALALRSVAHGVAYFERGLHARDAVAAYEARRKDLVDLAARAEDGAAAARKALAALTRVAADAHEMRAQLDARAGGVVPGAACGHSALQAVEQVV